jgi:hypothetical protein
MIRNEETWWDDERWWTRWGDARCAMRRRKEGRKEQEEEKSVQYHGIKRAGRIKYVCRKKRRAEQSRVITDGRRCKI